MNIPLKKLITLFYPDRCVCCGKIIGDGYFCKECEGLITPIEVRTCHNCGLPLKHCACDWNFYYFKEIATCFENTDDVKRAFYGFKFHGWYDRSEYFADNMLKNIKKRYAYEDFDYVCAVPTHKITVRERGYDQAEILAKRIARGMKVPFKRLLRQPKLTPKQHETGGFKNRYSNVKNKYKTVNCDFIKDKTLLLVDDIKTTGATLSECARELMLAGAAAVYAVTALVTYPKKTDQKNDFAIYEDDR